MEEKKKGIPKGCLITVAVILGLGIIGLIIGMLYCEDIAMYTIGKGLEMVSGEIKDNLPEGVTAEQVDMIVTNFKDGVKQKKVDQNEIQNIATMIQTSMQDEEMTKEEGVEILNALKAAVDDTTVIEMPTEPETDSLAAPETGDSL